MLTGIRFRCYPTPPQATTLLRWIGCQRFIYNAKVQEDRYFRAFKRTAVSLAGIPVPVDQEYSRFIGPDTAWLRDVPSQILRNGAVRWKQAYQRFFKGNAGRPTFHGKSGRQGVWLTRELFQFLPDETSTQAHPVWHLRLGTKQHPCGALKFTAHRPYALPASVTLSIEAGRWFVSFSYDDDTPEPPSDAELLALYQAMSAEALTDKAIGGDRGVMTPLVTSDGRVYQFQDIQLERSARKAIRRKKYQRRVARQQKGSGRRQRTMQTIARCEDYTRRVRDDFTHKTTHALAHSDHEIFFFEDLKITNMTVSPAPQQNDRGQYLPNGRAAKAGLNRAILSSCWGRLTRFLTYKAQRLGKLFLVVPPQGTSQACSLCEHRSPDNRRTQARFVCTACGHAEHADHNAAKTIQRRGIQLLRSGQFLPSKKTRSTQRSPSARTTAGTVECDARGGSGRRRRGQSSKAHAPTNRETLTQDAASS